MRAHAQPHLRADQPAYISSCHTHTGSLTNLVTNRRRLFSDLNGSGNCQLLNRIQVSAWRSCLGGWSTCSLCFPSTHFPSCGGFCTGAPTQGMEPRAKRGRIDPEHITASFPEEVRTYEGWATYPVDVLQLVCSQVGLAPAGSKHEMAMRLVGFFQLAGAGAAGGPGTSTAGGNDSTWSPSGRPRSSGGLRAGCPAPRGSPSDPAFPVYAVGSGSGSAG